MWRPNLSLISFVIPRRDLRQFVVILRPGQSPSGFLTHTCNRNSGGRLIVPAPFLRRTGWLAGFLMARAFKVGDHVSWNSEAGRVRGTILRVHTRDVNYKGYVHHASPDEPQYEIKSDKTDHVGLHKGRALRRLSR